MYMCLVLREFYQCVAFVSVSEDVSMLITSHDEQNRGSRLNCWVTIQTANNV